MSKAKWCPTEKKCLHTISEARSHARGQAMGMNREGKLAESSYVYRCPRCCTMHLTRRASWNGTPNTLVHEAAPEHLQKWAMGEQQ